MFHQNKDSYIELPAEHLSDILNKYLDNLDKFIESEIEDSLKKSLERNSKKKFFKKEEQDIIKEYKEKHEEYKLNYLNGFFDYESLLIKKLLAMCELADKNSKVNVSKEDAYIIHRFSKDIEINKKEIPTNL